MIVSLSLMMVMTVSLFVRMGMIVSLFLRMVMMLFSKVAMIARVMLNLCWCSANFMLQMLCDSGEAILA